MNNVPQNEPFKKLGQQLRELRAKLNETLADVSGAVEIDEPVLSRIEQGHIRPSEDILMLLISHFNMQEEDAVRLWQLAGYEKRALTELADFNDEPSFSGSQGRNTIILMGVDPRIIYSDSVQVSAAPSGVVISFGQANGNASPMVASRIGMSREQTAVVIRALQDALDHSNPEPPRLNSGKSA